MNETDPKIPLGLCPICGKPAVTQHRPFCSRRCALIDLSRWIGGNYRVPDDDKNDEAETPRDDDGEA